MRVVLSKRAGVSFCQKVREEKERRRGRPSSVDVLGAGDVAMNLEARWGASAQEESRCRKDEAEALVPFPHPRAPPGPARRATLRRAVMELAAPSNTG